LVGGKRALLACPVAISRPAWPGGDLVCAVDLGVNTAATCAIVDSAGAVRARQFLNCGRHNDRLDKAAAQVRVKAEHTLGPARRDKADKVRRPGRLGKGFCRGLYARMRGLNQAVAQQVANAIVAFAQDHGAVTVVFENLKRFRPTAGGTGSALRQRFHRWLHRLLVKKAAHKCDDLGLRLEFVAPRGTSAWAHDGSGQVSRDSQNYSLCTFASGKRYNADLNAALNIAARFIAKMLGVTTGDRPAADTGKSTGPASRMPIVLADVWRHAGAPC
jgi:IS605 OrfB family transposase